MSKRFPDENAVNLIVTDAKIEIQESISFSLDSHEIGMNP